MSSIYICYEKNDRKVVDDIVDYLEINGIECILVPDSIPKDDTYTTFVPGAIKRCNIFLLISSSNILKSKWISKEIEYAINNEKEIIQFVIEDFELGDNLSFLLGDTKKLNAKEEYINQLDDIILKCKKERNDDDIKEAINEVITKQKSKEERSNIKENTKSKSKNIIPENGIGKYELEDGGIYEGEWLNGKKNGFGIITYKNKGRIFCTYEDDIMDKIFIYIPFKNHPTYGSIYPIKLLITENDTEGIYFADTIESMLLDEEYKSLINEETNKNNVVYHGMGKIGNSKGIGELKYPNGEKYIGIWRYNERFGFGRQYYEDKSIYVGFFDFTKNGIGVQLLENGDLFFGLYKGGISQYGIKVENGIMSCSIYDFENYSKEWQTEMFLHNKGRIYKPRNILESGNNMCPYCHGYGKVGRLTLEHLNVYDNVIKSQILKFRRIHETKSIITPVNEFIKCNKCLGKGKIK